MENTWNNFDITIDLHLRRPLLLLIIFNASRIFWNQRRWSWSDRQTDGRAKWWITAEIRHWCERLAWRLPLTSANRSMLEAGMVLATTKDDIQRVVGQQRSTGVAGNGGRAGENLRLMSPDDCDGAENGIAVEARGRALKVHAGDTPHLVSLGSDRFSTAVTLHPIPKGIVFFFFFGCCIFCPARSLLCRFVAVCVFVYGFSFFLWTSIAATFSRMTCMLVARVLHGARDESWIFNILVSRLLGLLLITFLLAIVFMVVWFSYLYTFLTRV